MKLIFTITITQTIDNLENYQQPNISEDETSATTIQEAAALEQSWVDRGDVDPYDLIASDDVKIVVTGVDDEPTSEVPT